jgi:hypothetical protein
MTQHHIFRRRNDAAPLEYPVHIAIADMLRMALLPGWVWFHVPNGEQRSKAAGGRLKRMGVRPGVSDFLLVSPFGAQLHALELKRKHKSPSSDQTKFLQAIVDAGGRAEWCDTFEDAVEVLEFWGAIKGVHI